VNTSHDLPVINKTISIRSPRAVILMNPLFPVIVCMFGIAVVFTVWPEALDHSPISFERSGIIHHVWHYALLGGSTLSLIGMFGTFKRRLEVELAGLIVIAGCLALNFIALLGQVSHPDERVYPASGLALALRIAVISMILIRCAILVFRPTVDAPIKTEARG
jgi:hypothetical protein